MERQAFELKGLMSNYSDLYLLESRDAERSVDSDTFINKNKIEIDSLPSSDDRNDRLSLNSGHAS